MRRCGSGDVSSPFARLKVEVALDLTETKSEDCQMNTGTYADQRSDGRFWNQVKRGIIVTKAPRGVRHVYDR